MKNKRIKICFVSYYSYPLFNPDNVTIFGGSEVRCSLFAKELALQDAVDVSMVVFDHGQSKIEIRDGVTVLSHPVNTIHKMGELNTSANYDFYAKINADVYCTFGVHHTSEEIGKFCHLFGKKYVLFGGSDSDFAGDYKKGAKEINAYGSVKGRCYNAIELAHGIIVQTGDQEKLVAKNFGRESHVLMNPIDLSGIETKPGEIKRRADIVWIGKSDEIKRPEIVLNVAHALPQYHFSMIMNVARTEIHRRIEKKRPANITIIDRVEYKNIDSHIQGASLLLNTSIFEGFPNVFLQAAKYGVPIASLCVNPDQFITRFSCGIYGANDINVLVGGIQKALTDTALYGHYSQNIKQYVYQYHDLKKRSAELLKLLESWM